MEYAMRSGKYSSFNCVITSPQLDSFVEHMKSRFGDSVSLYTISNTEAKSKESLASAVSDLVCSRVGLLDRVVVNPATLIVANAIPGDMYFKESVNEFIDVADKLIPLLKLDGRFVNLTVPYIVPQFQKCSYKIQKMLLSSKFNRELMFSLMHRYSESIRTGCYEKDGWSSDYIVMAHIFMYAALLLITRARRIALNADESSPVSQVLIYSVASNVLPHMVRGVDDSQIKVIANTIMEPFSKADKVSGSLLIGQHAVRLNCNLEDLSRLLKYGENIDWDFSLTEMLTNPLGHGETSEYSSIMPCAEPEPMVPTRITRDFAENSQDSSCIQNIASCPVTMSSHRNVLEASASSAELSERPVYEQPEILLSQSHGVSGSIKGDCCTGTSNVLVNHLHMDQITTSEPVSVETQLQRCKCTDCTCTSTHCIGCSCGCQCSRQRVDQESAVPQHAEIHVEAVTHMTDSVAPQISAPVVVSHQQNTISSQMHYQSLPSPRCDTFVPITENVVRLQEKSPAAMSAHPVPQITMQIVTEKGEENISSRDVHSEVNVVQTQPVSILSPSSLTARAPQTLTFHQSSGSITERVMARSPLAGYQVASFPVIKSPSSKCFVSSSKPAVQSQGQVVHRSEQELHGVKVHSSTEAATIAAQSELPENCNRMCNTLSVTRSGTNLNLVTRTAMCSGSPRDGEVLVVLECISMDPVLHELVNTVKDDNSMALTSYGICRVIESRCDRFAAGDYMADYVSWTMGKFSMKPSPAAYKLDNSVPVEYACSLFGYHSLLAFTALRLCNASEGKTLLVNHAHSPIGLLACTYARRHLNMKVIAVATGSEHCSYLKNRVGMEHVIDVSVCMAGCDMATVEGKVKAYAAYLGELQQTLKEMNVSGLDCLFERAGGFQFDANLAVLNNNAHIALTTVDKNTSLTNLEKVVVSNSVLSGLGSYQSIMAMSPEEVRTCYNMSSSYLHMSPLYEVDAIKGNVQDMQSLVGSLLCQKKDICFVKINQ